MFYVNGSFSRSTESAAHVVANGTSVEGVLFHHHKQHQDAHMNFQMSMGQKRTARDWDAGYQEQETLTQMIPNETSRDYSDGIDNGNSYGRCRKRRKCGSDEIDKIPKGKRRYQQAFSSPGSDENDQRKVANNRERQRTKELNVGFAKLRNFVPMLPSDKQSKIQTLRLTSQYIQFLTDVIYRNETNDQPIGHLAEEYKKLLKYGFSTWRMQRDEIQDCETMS